MVKTPVNYTQKGTPYGVRVHAMLWSVEGRKENIIENREGTECSGQALSCLGVPFFLW